MRWEHTGLLRQKKVLKVFVAVTAKAGLLATLTADINVDLNDLPDVERRFPDAREWIEAAISA